MENPGSEPRRSRPGDLTGARTITIAALVFGVTFLFRFLTYELPNDHFLHVSRAQQILFGELPVRDFFDPGLPLQYYASAAALILSSHTLLGEVVLTAGCIALGTALTYVLAAAITSSSVLGLAAASLTVAVVPRLYNYPKVFLYVLGFLCAWLYFRHPSRRRLLVLSIVTVVAFLFRHDHGAYVAAAAVVGVGVLYWDNWRALVDALTRYAGVSLLLLLPWAIFVQVNGGLSSYFRASMPQAHEAMTLRFHPLSFEMAPRSQWFTTRGVTDPRVFVRWAESVDEPARRAKEAKYGLSQPVDRDGRTWSYILTGNDTDRIRALVQDRSVEDTHGIDRTTFQIDESLADRLARRIPLLRHRVSLGLMTDGNAVAWMYYLTVLLPIVAVCLLVVGWRRGLMSRADAALMAMVIALCLMVDQGILRDYPAGRLADVTAPTAVLAAWIISPWPRPRTTSPGRRRTRQALTVFAVLVTVWSAGRVGQARDLLRRSRLISNPLAIPAELTRTARELEQRPIDLWSQNTDSGLHVLTRYLLECTAPTDRVFVTWFAPEVYFYAERRFAGGQDYIVPGWDAADADQRRTVEWMKRQRVPVVLVNSALDGNPFKFDFPIVYKYIAERYQVAAVGTFGFDQTYTVLTDRQIQPTGTYDRFDLPCYR